MPYGSGYVAKYRGRAGDRSLKLMPSNGSGSTGPITHLAPVHILYLQALANGSRVTEVSHSKQMGKNRLAQIREFLNCRTTTQAVAESLRRGIIK